MIKAIATGDLHLGKRSQIHDQSADKLSTRYTWNKIVEWCTGNNVDLLLLTGDIVDRDNKFFEAVGPLKKGFETLKKAGIQVYMVSGNHDYDVLRDIVQTAGLDNIHLVGKGGKWELQVFENAAGEKLQLVGWSYPMQYVKTSSLLQFGGIDLDLNIPSVGLLHADVATVGSPYNPVAVGSFLDKKIDLWLLGHIHKPAELRGAAPGILYTGSPHALSSKESGIHGPLLLEINSKTVTVERVALSPVRYETLNLDISRCANQSSFRDALLMNISTDAEARSAEMQNLSYLVYHVVLTGHHVDPEGVNEWTHDIASQELSMSSGAKVLIRKVTNSAEMAVGNLELLSQSGSPLGILASAIIAIKNKSTTPFLEALKEKMKRKILEAQCAGVYQPLYRGSKLLRNQDPDTEAYLLKACNKLLTELHKQHVPSTVHP
jgi:DNA repair protein SbcD/Mre11